MSVFSSKKRKRKIELQNLKSEILEYYSGLPDTQVTAEHKEVLDYLKHNEIDIFPYEFQKKYEPENILIKKDKNGSLNYTYLDNKKLYYRKAGKKKKAQKYFNALFIEQDEKSPHLYLTKDFDVKENDVVVDVGAAEGIFALSVVEKAKELYLFEVNPKWLKALHATFEPWKDKVHIIPKFASNINDDNNVSLDHFFKDKGEINFLKLDVEGAEALVLDGCAELLNQNNLKAAICSYHKQHDKKDIENILKSYNFSISHSSGFMIYDFDKNFGAPYLRRGVLRAEK